jgi:hypothetical protein
MRGIDRRIRYERFFRTICSDEAMLKQFSPIPDSKTESQSLTLIGAPIQLPQSLATGTLSYFKAREIHERAW